jgi:hypothetical protein
MISIGSIKKIMFRTMIKLQTKQAPSKPPFDHYRPQGMDGFLHSAYWKLAVDK